MIEPAILLRFGAALLLVVGLIGLAAWVAKRLLGGSVAAGRGKRLAVVEALPLDGRARLLLLRRDDVEHLVCVGPAGVSVIETGLAARAKEPAS